MKQEPIAIIDISGISGAQRKQPETKRLERQNNGDKTSGDITAGDITVRYSHGGGGSRKINAWHIYTLMVYL
jgi:hypothetical protein